MLFSLLLLAHLLTDFTLQTIKMAQLKTKSRLITAAHASIFGLLSFVFLLPYLSRFIGGCILLLTILHYLVDRARAYIIERFRCDNLLLFLMDQGVHLGFIGLIAFFQEPLLPYIDKRLMAYLVGYLLVTHPSIIFIYYAAKDLLPHSNHSSLILDNRRKYLTILERGVCLSLFLLPGYFYLFVPVLTTIRVLLERDLLYKFNVGTGNLIAAAIGLYLRLFLNEV